jgi:hypothetical protein
MRSEKVRQEPDLPNSPGSHISAPGDYRTQIEALTNKYPNLVHENRQYEYDSRCASFPKVACFELGTSNTGKLYPFTTEAELRKHLTSNHSESNGQTPRRRLYILEGTNLGCVDAFGTAFQVDPSVFVRHRRIYFWETDHLSGNTPPLPSLLDPQRSFLMEYHELLYFKTDLEQLYVKTGREKFYLRSAGNERHIALSRLDGKLQDVGIAHRKASFWARKDGVGGWDGTQLACIPPI